MRIGFWKPQKGTCVLSIENAYEIKDKLKAKGYRYNPQAKTWMKWIGWKSLMTEFKWLASLGVKISFWFFEYPPSPETVKFWEKEVVIIRKYAEINNITFEDALYEYVCRRESLNGQTELGEWIKYACSFVLDFLKEIGLIKGEVE